MVVLLLVVMLPVWLVWSGCGLPLALELLAEAHITEAEPDCVLPEDGSAIQDLLLLLSTMIGDVLGRRDDAPVGGWP